MPKDRKLSVLDQHLLVNSYSGRNPENFSSFVSFRRKAAGRPTMGRTKMSSLAALVEAHRRHLEQEYADADEAQVACDSPSRFSSSAGSSRRLAAEDEAEMAGASARMQRVYHEVLRPKMPVRVVSAGVPADEASVSSSTRAVYSSDSSTTLDSEAPTAALFPSGLSTSRFEFTDSTGSTARIPPSAPVPALLMARQGRTARMPIPESRRRQSPPIMPNAAASPPPQSVRPLRPSARRVEFTMPGSGRGFAPINDDTSDSGAGDSGRGIKPRNKKKKSVAKNEILQGVDDATVRYIDATLTQPDHLVFNKYTRFFLDPKLEDLYQEYTAVDWFPRARWHMALWIAVHFIVQLLFVTLPNSGFHGMAQFELSYRHAPAYLQWTYLLLALPFAALPETTNLFQKRWRWWVCMIIVLFNATFEAWLAHASHLAVNEYAAVVYNKTECLATNADLAPFFEENAPSRDQGSLVGANSSAATTALSVLADDQATLAVITTELYAGALTQLLVGFASLFSFLFIISIRLEFVQVGVVALLAVLTYAAIISAFNLHLEGLSAYTYSFAVVMFLILSYSTDRTNRRSFLSNFLVEKENEHLKSTLKEAEAALMNEPARDEEKQVVASILEAPDMQHLDAMRIPFDDLKFLQAIGRGAMGDVIKARYFGTMVVCKRMRRDHITATSIARFRDEMELMAGLRHPNVVQLIGASWDNCSNLCLVMEYLENGDVHSVLHSRLGANFTWADPLLKMAIDVVQGMLYLHSLESPVVHRDLKSVNIMCSATFGCKVGDFGLSRRYKRARSRRRSRSRRSQRSTSTDHGSVDGEECDGPDETIDALTTLVGTPFWLAPEIIRSERYGPAADVYSFGIVLTELESRQTPYHDVRETGLRVLMRIAHHRLRPTLPTTCAPVRRSLIKDCWHDDPVRRPTFAQVLERLQGPVLREIEGQATHELGRHQRRVLRDGSTQMPSPPIVTSSQ